MRISIISDLHIVSQSDSAFEVFQKFIRHHLVQSSDQIILLGDVLDFMVGNFEGFLKDHDYFFATLKELKDKKIIYFYGNHDFNFENIFKNFKIELRDSPLILDVEHKKIYISHGDDEEIDNDGYKRYKKIVRSPITNAMINLIPYPIIKKIGEKASADSRKRGKHYFDETKNREKFRISATQVAKQGFDVVILGHSHICENYNGFYSGKSFLYINNGLPSKDKKFIFIDEGKVDLISLD